MISLVIKFLKNFTTKKSETAKNEHDKKIHEERYLRLEKDRTLLKI